MKWSNCTQISSFEHITSLHFILQHPRIHLLMRERPFKSSTTYHEESEDRGDQELQPSSVRVVFSEQDVKGKGSLLCRLPPFVQSVSDPLPLSPM
ncbi:hypothetical protein E2C01_043483 [Portunus trituberculatus]|uniref:Uncharacterized protein n=1 Tax=Portunus trituberculatus TaxID=210409 RepID=A0A5B7FXG3_PORTR|nr:hypothetical protein [Portunus trituberculatus]